jgi:cytochrome b561
MTSSALDNATAMMNQNGVSGASRDRYSRVAIVLHWAIAAFIIFNLCSGYFMESWMYGSLKGITPPPISWMSLVLHVSTGLTVLALTVVRVIWRLLNAPPPYPVAMKPWERHTAQLAHFLLYAAMVLMPLTGWSILSARPPEGSAGAAAAMSPPPAASAGVQPGAAPAPVRAPPPGPPPILKVWNVLPMPVITPLQNIGKEPSGVAAQHVLHEQFTEWHGMGSFLLLGLLMLHVLGALKHQFIDKQSEFARMGIGRKKPS